MKLLQELLLLQEELDDSQMVITFDLDDPEERELYIWVNAKTEEDARKILYSEEGQAKIARAFQERDLELDFEDATLTHSQEEDGGWDLMFELPPSPEESDEEFMDDLHDGDD